MHIHIAFNTSERNAAIRGATTDAQNLFIDRQNLALGAQSQRFIQDEMLFFVTSVLRLLTRDRFSAIRALAMYIILCNGG